MADDLGHGDLGCYNKDSKIPTPNMDRMAAEGVRLTDFYAGAPVGSGTRAGLMTGCYPQRVCVTWQIFPSDYYGLNPAETTIAELLKTRGYATACVGKWHLGHGKLLLPTRQGFDTYFGIPYSNNMSTILSSLDAPPAERNNPLIKYDVKGTPLVRMEKVIEHPVDQRTITGRYTQEAIDFIRNHQGGPFFLYLAHTMPHVPVVASPVYAGKSAAGPYGDAVEEIDASTGAILKTLADLSLAERTLVVFCSDNGPLVGSGKLGGSAKPFRGGKGTTLEGGMRVPCIARWPGRIPPGIECRQITATMDLLPTFARLAGAQLPADRKIDGRDIWPLLSGAAGAAGPRAAYFYYRRYRLEAVRSGPWKLHFRGARLNRDAKPAHLKYALYHLIEDPGEQRNVVTKYPSIAKQLAALSDPIRAELGDANLGIKGREVRPAGFSQ